MLEQCFEKRTLTMKINIKKKEIHKIFKSFGFL